MQQPTQTDKEIQAALQSMHSQIVVTESEMQSKEGVRRIIKKYQGRIAEMSKLMQRQKRHNENLQSEFKQLNEQLNTVMKKIQQKPKDETPKDQPNRSQITKKQLENQIKKNSILKKQLDQLKYKFQYLDGEKIDSFKNQIKQKERIIDQLNAKIKLFEKLDKQLKDGQSYKKEEQLTQKIMQQNEEIVHLKKKVQQHKKKEEDLEKNIKSLRQQISSLQGKLASTKPVPDDKSKDKGSEKGVQEQFEKLKEKYKQLQSAKKMNDKSSRHEIDSLHSKLRNVQKQLAEAKEAVSRKDKESNIILFKLKEKERKNFNTLEPIKTARYSEQVLHNTSGGLFDTRKSFRGLSWGQGVYRQFDDSSKLPTEKNYRIKRLVFTYFEEHVLSLTSDYHILQGDFGKDVKRQTKTIQSFAIPTQYNNIQIAEHLFGDYEYIIGMDVYCGKGVEFIRITTSKEHLLQVGNPKSVPKCKLHSFEIGSHEKPIALMGVIEQRRHGTENREYLVNIGLQLRKKEVFIRGRNRRVESSLNRSIVGASNDKNRKE